MTTEQLIQNYIANRLSEADKAKVDHLLETDSAFKNEFEAHKDMAVAFKISEAESLKKRFQELDKGPKQQKLKISSYLYLAVASMVILGFFYTFYSSPSSDQLYASYFDISPNTYQPVTRTADSTKNNAAFVAYENGNFTIAENEFETLLETTNNPNLLYYYASSLLNQSKFDLALKQFEILNQIDFDYTDESLWYTALIYVKNEDYDNAKAQLKRLKAKNSTFKTKERKALLEDL